MIIAQDVHVDDHERGEVVVGVSPAGLIPSYLELLQCKVAVMMMMLLMTRTMLMMLLLMKRTMMKICGGGDEYDIKPCWAQSFLLGTPGVKDGAQLESAETRDYSTQGRIICRGS